MSIFKGFLEGVRSYSKALRFISRNKLSWFFIFPLLLNIFLFWVGYSWIADLSDTLKLGMDNWISGIDYGFVNNEYVKNTFDFLLKTISIIGFFLVFMSFGGYLIVAIMSPIFSIISEKTEKIITGKDYPFDFMQLLKDVVRGVFLALRNITKQILISILLFVLSFVPLLGFFTPVLLFLVSAYFFGFSFMDYAIERQRLGVKDSVKYMRDNKGLVIGNGIVFALLLLVPFCGVFLSAFAAVVSVVAGTLLVAAKNQE
jgi:CysZ protein